MNLGTLNLFSYFTVRKTGPMALLSRLAVQEQSQGSWSVLDFQCVNLLLCVSEGLSVRLNIVFLISKYLLSNY